MDTGRSIAGKSMTIAVFGNNGGAAKSLADYDLIVPAL
jgi:hypothetical protein